MEIEVWKYIEGTCDIYVSNFGRLKIQDKVVESYPLSHGKPSKTIKRDGKYKKCFIHLLVLEYFPIDKPPKEPGHLLIGYRDNNPCNAARDNLYYTYSNRAIKKTQEEFENEVQAKFKHLQVVGTYVDSYTEIDIKCLLHDLVFPITPVSLLDCKYGCPSCNSENRPSNIAYTKEEFIAKSIEKFGDTFDYSTFVYKGCREDTVFTCKARGHRYKQKPYVHLSSSIGCKVCNKTGSSESERAFLELCKRFDSDTVHSYRPKWLLGKEIDIYIPSKGLAIEYNGYTSHHSSPDHVDTYMAKRAKSSTYHLDKYLLCKENGVDLIHIFDFEDSDMWVENLTKLLGSNVEYLITYTNNKRIIDDYVIYGESKITFKQ